MIGEINSSMQWGWTGIIEFDCSTRVGDEVALIIWEGHLAVLE